ncbi:MAG: hypothetical protein ABSF94_10610 [Steroidobacteraceae bacterium]|jgi:hypothetical protein
MSPRTIFLSRLFGLYCLIAALCLFVRGPAIGRTVASMLQDAPLIFFIGVVLLATGLAIVLAHNIWTGALAVVVTLIGWATALKGAMFLAIPPQAIADFYLNELHYEQLVYLFAAFSLVVGLYLCYGGFQRRPPAHSSAP